MSKELKKQIEKLYAKTRRLDYFMYTARAPLNDDVKCGFMPSPICPKIRKDKDRLFLILI